MSLAEGVSFLAEQGLNLYAVLACDDLPVAVVESIAAAGIRLHDYRRLVLIASGGQRLWQVLQKQKPAVEDPIDSFSRVIVERFAQQYLHGDAILPLYPGNFDVPLQQLGIQAGWHHTSPLGIGINPEYGLWFAYRVAFLTTLDLPVTSSGTGQSQSQSQSHSPCISCTTKPCISACPGKAVSATATFNIPNCISYRLADVSACQLTCLARLACPVASQYRYSEEQIAYHYGRSMHSIKAYASSCM